MPAGTLERTTSSGSCESSAVESARSQTTGRKSSKPIMEKRRRARINESLGHLKTLILDALKKDSSRHSKLEKADILEMTVKHLRNLQRFQMTAAATADPSVLGKYRAGFSECVGEVTRYLSTCDEVNSEARTRLLSHLAARVSQMYAVNFYTPHSGPLGQSAVNAPRVPCKNVAQIRPPADTLNLHASCKVVPTPDGHFAFLVPSAALAPLGAHGGYHVPPGAPPLTSDSVWRPW
ncbi:transcription factor HES-1-like [Hippocampus zosterae]|uniref:transcription factor HES-1-like n=1 Tax=Hippocampus zosterae TaxID=109293 RepID=UPI00223CF7BB|nr:transcription factor HES-1-like [Hippocampus zosterae]